MPEVSSNGITYAAFDPTQSVSQNAQGMINNENQNYQSFMNNLPQYQSSLNNQTLDQGASGYNQKKQAIDTSANKRGLLYSGLKQGAEQGAASESASDTANKIASNNKNLSDYVTSYGNQVAGSNIANQQGNVNSALQGYGQQMGQYGQNQQMIGSLLGGGGAVAGAIKSDKNVKEDVKSGDKDANEMVGKIKASTYRYKDDPNHEKHLGLIAQDLEKSKMGKSLVIDTPKGKAVDTTKALAAVMAVQGALDKRMKRAGA